MLPSREIGTWRHLWNLAAWCASWADGRGGASGESEEEEKQRSSHGVFYHDHGSPPGRRTAAGDREDAVKHGIDLDKRGRRVITIDVDAAPSRATLAIARRP
jgi:hypothetical protein